MNSLVVDKFHIWILNYSENPEFKNQGIKIKKKFFKILNLYNNQ